MFLDHNDPSHESMMEALEAEFDSYEADNEYDSVLEAALDNILDSCVALEKETVPGTKPRGHILTKEKRDSLPDSAFGIPGKRKYPLVVKGDKKTTEELISRAVQMFHFCNPAWKEELAKNIVKAIQENDVAITIHPKSQINKFVTVPSEYLKVDTEDKYHRTK